MKLVKIGRDNQCNLILRSMKVSALHAEMTLMDNGEIYLEDKSSTNGTFVGGIRIEPNVETKITFGDKVVFGDTALDWTCITDMKKENSKYKKIYKNVLPNVGDIIMFDKTTSDTKKLTHAGIVIDVDEKDETVTYIHASTSKGLILGYMNLKYPDLARKDGKIINSYLKRGGGVNALASHCFNSYGTILDIPEK